MKSAAFVTILTLFLTTSGCIKDSYPVVQENTMQDFSKVPTVSTGIVTGISTDSAVVVADVVADNGSVIEELGVYWSLDSFPVKSATFAEDKTNKFSFTAKLTKLQPGTVYYARAYARNAKGIGYGNSQRFSTSVKDIDDNVYRTVVIGKQLWMVENLKTTHYRNGDPITKITDVTTWENTFDKTGGYCNYDNDEANATIYGRLYNYTAANDSRNVCPQGWRMPTSGDWSTLIHFLGGNLAAGGRLKEIGTTHWISPNIAASNSVGFTALPGGYMDYGGFRSLGSSCYFWSAPGEKNTQTIKNTDQGIAVTGNELSVMGMSIRCIREIK